jgi:hypothetical protein
LADVIYPKVVDRMLVHYSNQRRIADEHAIEIPFEWSNDCFCGRTEGKFSDRQQPSLQVKPFRLQGPLPNLTTLYR